MVASAPWLAAALLFLTGATAAPLYPISKAQAYRALPGDSAAVGAAGALFSPIELVLPFALGWLAEAAGLRVALLALLAQRLGVLVIALAARDATTTTP